MWDIPRRRGRSRDLAKSPEPLENIRDVPKTSSFGYESAAVQRSRYDLRGTFCVGYSMVT